MPASRSLLTERDVTALTAMAAGLTLDATAGRLGVARTTLHTRLRRVQDKLGARNVTHAVALAAFAGLIDPAPIHANALPTTADAAAATRGAPV